jgi:tetratricopeptide (TPR) repeat protein
MSETENSLQLGIAAYKAGDKQMARSYLLKAVRENPESEQAWGWLSTTATNLEERIHCLRQVIRINPANISADKLLKELESNEWLKAGSAPSSQTNVAGTSVSAAPTEVSNATVRTTAGSDTIQLIIVILLVIMVLFWLGVGFLQLAFSFESTVNFDLLCFGGGNIVFSIINGFFIAPVVARKKSALQQLYILAAIGSVLGTFQLLFYGAYLQVCAIPLYILIGILAYINREAFVK